MDDKKTSLFRKKNLEKIESPESLNDYLQVTSPGVWLVLIAIIFFLIGTCIWGFFGHIDSKMKAAVISENGSVICLVPDDALQSVIQNRTLSLNGSEYELAPDTVSPEAIGEDTNIYWILAGDYSIGDIVYRIPLTASLPDGVYSGTIITETISPFSLLLN